MSPFGVGQPTGDGSKDQRGYREGTDASPAPDLSEPTGPVTQSGRV